MTKKEKLLLAKKEKKVKLQKATECYKEGIEKYHKAKTRDEYEDAAGKHTHALVPPPCAHRHALQNPTRSPSRSGRLIRSIISLEQTVFERWESINEASLIIQQQYN